MEAASSRIVLKSLLILPPEPPVVGALGDSKLSEYLTLGETGRGYPGKYRRLLQSAHPLVPVSSWAIGIAVFLRRYPSRDNSATNCFSSTFSLS